MPGLVGANSVAKPTARLPAPPADIHKLMLTFLTRRSAPNRATAAATGLTPLAPRPATSEAAVSRASVAKNTTAEPRPTIGEAIEGIRQLFSDHDKTRASEAFMRDCEALRRDARAALARTSQDYDLLCQLEAASLANADDLKRQLQARLSNDPNYIVLQKLDEIFALSGLAPSASVRSSI